MAPAPCTSTLDGHPSHFASTPPRLSTAQLGNTVAPVIAANTLQQAQGTAGGGPSLQKHLFSCGLPDHMQREVSLESTTSRVCSVQGERDRPTQQRPFICKGGLLESWFVATASHHQSISRPCSWMAGFDGIFDLEA